MRARVFAVEKSRSTMPSVAGERAYPCSAEAEGARGLNTRKPLTQRARQKLETRRRLLAAARAVFILKPYDEATLREIADVAGLTMGAIGNHFVDKAELWREAMGEEPPGDTPITRAAHAMFDALRSLLAERPADWRQSAAWRAADEAFAKAEGRSDPAPAITH